MLRKINTTTKKQKNTLDAFLDKCVYFVSFFLLGGFYSVLAIVISIGGNAATRFVTVPLRLSTSIVMTIVIVAHLFFKRRSLPKRQKIIIFTFLLFWAFYILKIMHHYSSGAPLRLAWLEYILFAVNFSILPFLMYSIAPFKKYKKIIINAFISSGMIMGVVCIYLYRSLLFLGVGLRGAKYASSNFEETLGPLALSYVSIFTIILCVYQLIYLKNKSKMYLFYLLTTIALSLVMFLLGASRGSVLAFTVSLAYLIYMGDLKNKLRIGAMIIIFAPILIWSVEASGSSIFRRTSSSVETGNTGREDAWATAITEFVENPIIGGRIEINFHPHNMFIETLMAMGLLGFSILLLFVIGAMIRAIELPKISHDFLWVSAILIQGVCANLFSGALYGATLVFFPMAILLSNFPNKK